MKDLQRINAEEWEHRIAKAQEKYRFQHRYRLAFDRLVKRKPSTWIDVGTGNGFLPDLVKPVLPGTSVVGIDFVPDVMRASDSLDHRLAVNTDAGHLPFESDSFEYVTCLDVLEHVVLPDHLLSEIRRVLVPGGHALFSVPNLQFVEYVASLARGKMPHPAADPRHMSIFTLDFLKKKMISSGLSVSYSAGCDASPSFLSRVSIRYLCKTIMVEVEKPSNVV